MTPHTHALKTPPIDFDDEPTLVRKLHLAEQDEPAGRTHGFLPTADMLWLALTIADNAVVVAEQAGAELDVITGLKRQLLALRIAGGSL